MIHTDFPDPVAPATNKCGNLFNSIVNASPVVVLPIAIVNWELELIYCSEFSIVFK